MYPTYLQDKIDYINKESAQHGGNMLFVVGEIQRAQLDLLKLDIPSFDDRNISNSNPINVIKSFFTQFQKKVQYISDKNELSMQLLIGRKYIDGLMNNLKL